MWVERPPDEVAQWHEITRRDARSHGLTIAGVVLMAAVVVGVAGLSYTRMGLIVHRGGTWVRGLTLAIVAVPLSFWICRVEARKEIAKATRRAVCPACDVAGENRAGQSCPCGGTFVPQSSVKWVEGR